MPTGLISALIIGVACIVGFWTQVKNLLKAILPFKKIRESLRKRWRRRQLPEYEAIPLEEIRTIEV